MSANRSVQAAQRRRAGPTPDSNKGGPHTSINSAQMFANQARPGQGPSMPNGRLAGQQVSMQQKYMKENPQPENHGDILSTITKLTVPQAITLITVRLGVLESKLLKINGGEDGENGSNIDASIIESMLTRIQTLEANNNGATSNGECSTNSEISLLKQQFEAVKQTMGQIKNTNTNLAKENLLFKTSLDAIKNDLKETKDLIKTMNNLVIEHSDKIFKLEMNNADTNADDSAEITNEATNEE